MQALVLVGGEGTRLRPLTATLPKPAVPLCGRPMLEYMIDWLAQHGVTDVILACGFRAERLRAVLGDGGGSGPPLRYVEEPSPLGTAGAIKHAEELLEDRFLALNGDVLTDLDLTALIAQHSESGARATLALHEVDDPAGYGLVGRDDENAVTEFVEKPEPSDAAARPEISAGAYVLEKDVLEHVPPGRECSIERDVFPALVGNGLFALPLDGYWLDVGTPERYLQATWDILEGRIEATVSGEDAGDGVLLGDSVRIEPGARVGPRAVIGAGGIVEADAVVTESVLLDDCHIGSGATVRGAILAPGSEVASGASVESGTVTAEHEHVGVAG